MSQLSPDTNDLSVEERREKNRREMPNVADVIDTFNEFFGPVRVIGAEDYVTGKRVGRLEDDP